MFNHYSSCCLAGEKRSLKIDRDHAVEIFFTHVFGQIAWGHACVVHQDIEAPEVLRRPCNSLLNLANVTHLHLQGKSSTAAGNDLRFQSGVVPKFSQSYRYVSSGLGERECNGPAQAARCACHQGNLAIEIERW